MIRITVAQRRQRLMRRHQLTNASRASSVAEVAEGLVALHATDPATVYLSILARCPTASLGEITTALYAERRLIKMMSMRRTMFVVPSEYAPAVHGATGPAIAARLRRRLVQQLQTTPTDPEIDTEDVDSWLTEVQNATERALLARGEALANELATDEPRLRTMLLPTTDNKWDTGSYLTSLVLTLMGAEGRVVRGRPAGSWLSRQHRWAPVRDIWPDGMPAIPTEEAQRWLAHRWLAAFGPATVADLRWWTGWTLSTTRSVLALLDVVEVDLGGVDGIMLAEDMPVDAPRQPTEPPAVTLLPALDATPMGWQERDWFLGPHRDTLFDRNGNIGPTVWCDGRVIGGWGMRDGEVMWRLPEDTGSEVVEAVRATATDLQARLAGASVIPTFRTPLERELSAR